MDIMLGVDKALFYFDAEYMAMLVLLALLALAGRLIHSLRSPLNQKQNGLVIQITAGLSLLGAVGAGTLGIDFNMWGRGWWGMHHINIILAGALVALSLAFVIWTLINGSGVWVTGAATLLALNIAMTAQAISARVGYPSDYAADMVFDISRLAVVIGLVVFVVLGTRNLVRWHAAKHHAIGYQKALQEKNTEYIPVK